MSISAKTEHGYILIVCVDFSEYCESGGKRKIILRNICFVTWTRYTDPRDWLYYYYH